MLKKFFFNLAGYFSVEIFVIILSDKTEKTAKGI